MTRKGDVFRRLFGRDPIYRALIANDAIYEDMYDCKPGEQPNDAQDDDETDINPLTRLRAQNQLLQAILLKMALVREALNLQADKLESLANAVETGEPTSEQSDHGMELYFERRQAFDGRLVDFALKRRIDLQRKDWRDRALFLAALEHPDLKNKRRRGRPSKADQEREDLYFGRQKLTKKEVLL